MLACATQERKVSPPNLPTPDFFVPLGALISYVKSGNKFTPVHVEDIRSGRCMLFDFSFGQLSCFCVVVDWDF